MGIWEILFFFLSSQTPVVWEGTLEGNWDCVSVPCLPYWGIFKNEDFLAHMCSKMFFKTCLIFKAFVCSFKDLFSTCNVLALLDSTWEAFSEQNKDFCPLGALILVERDR